MKKLVCFLLALFVLTGCGNMGNTPTKKVENFLNKYQTNDEDVMSDLEDVLTFDTDLTDDERTDYREFMKKHYQDMTYKIKNETIDGDSATVDAEITVRNYANAVNSANDYRLSNADEFDTDNTFASYRLGELKNVTDTVTYTITFHLTKVNDEWTVDPISADDENKLNGLYGVNDLNSSIINDNETTNDTTNTNDATDNRADNNNTNANDGTNNTADNNTNVVE